MTSAKKKKLLLAFPNQRWLKDDPNTVWDLNPHTLCLLGAMVKDEVDVKIVDCQFYQLSVEDFAREVKEYAPDYVGISMLSSEYAPVLDTAAAAVKGVSRDIIVIVGGVHVTLEYEDIIKNPDIDYAIRGEGEFVLRDLLRYLDNKGPMPTEGLVYMQSGLIEAQPQAFIHDLTVLPMADYSLVKMEDYVMRGSRVGPQRPPEFPYIRMAVTRGCPFSCSFCQVEQLAGRKVRTKDPEAVVEEIIYLQKTYGIKSILFDDDDMIAAKKFFKRLMELFIERKLNIKFIFNGLAVFLINDELLDLMVRAGCQGVNIAIESGNERILKEVIGKPVKLDKAPPMIEKLKKAGLFVLANFIIGFPGESWDEIRQTIRYAEHCGADYVKMFIAVPLKGTRLWDMWVEMQRSKDPNFVPEQFKTEWRFGQITSDEWTSKDISILRAYEWDRINFGTPERRRRVSELWGLNEEELAKIRKRTRDAITF